MKNKKDESSIQKLLDKMRKKTDNDEIKNLEKLKKQVKQIKTIEELEDLEDQLDEIGVLDKEKLDKLKKKKRKQLERQNQTFEERIRCNLETINRIIAIGKAYKQKERTKEEKDLLQSREERDRNSKIKQKSNEERTRSSGGRTRGDR